MIESDWPDIPPRLIERLEEWARTQTFAVYTPGMTAEQALGSLAEIAGVGRVLVLLKSIRDRQLVQAQTTSIPSHVRSDDAAAGPKPNNSGRWRGRDRR